MWIWDTPILSGLGLSQRYQTEHSSALFSALGWSPASHPDGYGTVDGVRVARSYECGGLGEVTAGGSPFPGLGYSRVDG